MQQHRRTFLARAISKTAAVLYGSHAGFGQKETHNHGTPPDCSELEAQILD
jgi:hypothetical protein